MKNLVYSLFFLLFCFFICFSSCSSDFELGSSSNPISGKVLVSLYYLQTDPSYASSFYNEYNIYGISTRNISIDSCCILVQEGTLYYGPNGYSDTIVPYVNQTRDCNSYLPEYVNFGSDNGVYFSNINITVLNSWNTTTSSDCFGESYALYGIPYSSYTPLPSYQPTVSSFPSPSYYPSSSYYPSYTSGNSEFEISSLEYPVSGKQLVSLYNLQNDYNYAQKFMNEYNNGGISIESIYVNYCCILVEEGALYYEPNGSTDNLITFLNGNRYCNSYISQPVTFGTTDGEYFNVLNSTTISSWSADYASTCSTSNTYALYGPYYQSTASPSVTSSSYPSFEYSPSYSYYPSSSISPSSTSSNFVVSSTDEPVSGKQLVSLYDLQNNYNYAQLFINDYNNGGLTIEYVNIDYCCVLVEEGAIYYIPGGINDEIVTYVNEEFTCSSYITQNIKFGTDFEYFNYVNSSIIAQWDTTTSATCALSNSYALYGPYVSTNISASISPSQSPSNSYFRTATNSASSSSTLSTTPTRSYYATSTVQSSQYTCCLYFSAAQQYESSFCQLNNYQCPYIGTFTEVGNYTVNACDSCSIYGY